MKKFLSQPVNIRERAGSVGSLETNDSRQREASLNNTEDQSKRKREIEENLNLEYQDKTVFKRSNLVKRSPHKSRERDTKIEMEEILKRLEVLNIIQEDLKEIRLTNQRAMKNYEELKEEMLKTRTFIEEENRELKSRVELLENKIKEIEKTEEYKEKKEKKKNIIISGKDLKKKSHSVENIAREVISKMCSKLPDIEEIRSIPTKHEESTVILVKFKNFQDKLELMKNKPKLKGEDIYVNDDLTKKEADIQKRLRDLARTESVKGNRTQVGYQKIKINGIWKEWKDISVD